MSARTSLFLLGTILFVAHLTGCGSGGGGGSDRVDDTKAPSVTSTFPTLNSTGVDLDISITAKFSEAIEPATITTDSVLLFDVSAGTFLDGDITYDPSSKTAIFRNAALSPFSNYTAILTNWITDLAGNPLAEYSWDFTTGAALDMTPPTVDNNYPLDGSVDVYLNSIVVATFSEPIDPATMIAQNFILQDSGATVISGDLDYIGTSVLFTPTNNMIGNELYTFTVGNQVKDLAGNELIADYIWSFTTGIELDSVAPMVIAVSPEDGAVDVPLNSVFKATFDEPIMPFELGQVDGSPVTIEFSPTYNTAYMQPTAGLLPGTTYNVSIFASDMAQIQMTDIFSWKFSTIP